MDPNTNPIPNPSPTPAPSAAPAPEPAAPAAPAEPVVAPAAKTRKPLPKKLIFMIGGGALLVLLIILGIIFIPKMFGGDKASEAKEVFSEDILIPVKENDKYGYIDLKGKMKISPQFYNADEFQGDFAVVKKEEGDNHSVIIDRKGQVKLEMQPYDSAYYYSETKIWRVGEQLYDKNLNKILPDNKEIYDYSNGYFIVGPSLGSTDYDYSDLDAKQSVELYNSKGKSVYKYETSKADLEVTEYGDTLGETYCGLALEENKSIIVNCDSGKVIKNDINYNVESDDYTSFLLRDGYKRVGYYLVSKNKVVFETESDDVDFYLYGNGDEMYYEIEDDNTDETKYFLIKKGELTDTKPATSAASNSLSSWEIYTGYTIISCGKTDGLMKGKTQVVPCNYEDIKTPDILTYEYLKSKGKTYVIGRNDDTSHIINAKNGKVVQTFDYGYLNFEDESSFVAFRKDRDSKSYTIHNLVTGKTQVINGSSVSCHPMYVRVYNEDGKYEYKKKNLKLFYTEQQ